MNRYDHERYLIYMSYKRAQFRQLKRSYGVVAILLLVVSTPVMADALYTRNLECQQQGSLRAKEICQKLEQALAWSWTGHAIISPSFRLNTEALPSIYCGLPITASDTEYLVAMALDSEFKRGMIHTQISNGVSSLLAMLGQLALDNFPAPDSMQDKSRRSSAQYIRQTILLSIAEDSSSIFNPSHVHYILRDGCPGQ